MSYDLSAGIKRRVPHLGREITAADVLELNNYHHTSRLTKFEALELSAKGAGQIGVLIEWRSPVGRVGARIIALHCHVQPSFLHPSSVSSSSFPCLFLDSFDIVRVYFDCKPCSFSGGTDLVYFDNW